jgi:hypothetical protein
MSNEIGFSLQKEFEEAVLSINKHTKESRHCKIGNRNKVENEYCVCEECTSNRQKLNSLSSKMNNIGYQRKAMF